MRLRESSQSESRALAQYSREFGGSNANKRDDEGRCGNVFWVSGPKAEHPGRLPLRYRTWRQRRHKHRSKGHDVLAEHTLP